VYQLVCRCRVVKRTWPLKTEAVAAAIQLASPSKLTSVIILAASMGAEPEIRVAPNSISSQPFLILRQLIEVRILYSPDRLGKSCALLIAHAFPISFHKHHLLSRPKCRRASASASHSHSDKPSPAQDKQSSVAIRPPPVHQQWMAHPHSRGVSSSDYGQARLGSRLFISGMIHHTTKGTSTVFTPSQPIAIA
jgi:hypothetical protein